MASTSSSQEPIYTQVGDQRFEMTGAELELYLADRKTEQEAETAQAERATKLASAITKLKALGLTEAEAKVVIGIE
jgi:DNA-binding transcriptional regulator YhcF (GntR family)